MDDKNNVVVAIKDGIVAEVYTQYTNTRVMVVNLDLKENNSKIFEWPETQYDEERVGELLAISK